MSLLLLTPLLLTSFCSGKPIDSRGADVPLSASDSVATFTWTGVSQTATATFTFPQERRAEPTWPRHFHHPLDIYRLAKSTQTTKRAEFIVTPKHQVEHPPLKTDIHHEPESEGEGPPSSTAKEPVFKTGIHHEPISLAKTPLPTKKQEVNTTKDEPKPTNEDAEPTKIAIPLGVPTDLALLHEAAILHERRDVSTFTVTGISTTATFTFTSPTGAGAFSDLSAFTGTTTVKATWDGSTTTMTFNATNDPVSTADADKRANTTPAPTPSAFPIHAPNNCAQACDAADVSCSSLLTTYTANTLCSKFFTSCHNFCSLASATAPASQ